MWSNKKSADMSDFGWWKYSEVYLLGYSRFLTVYLLGYPHFFNSALLT